MTVRERMEQEEYDVLAPHAQKAAESQGRLYPEEDNDVRTTTQKFDKAVFAEALSATAKHLGTAEQITDVPGILHNIEESPELRAMWDKYRKQFAYAQDITYEQIIDVVRTLVE